jgi:hypothetical protein
MTARKSAGAWRATRDVLSSIQAAGSTVSFRTPAAAAMTRFAKVSASFPMDGETREVFHEWARQCAGK